MSGLCKPMSVLVKAGRNEALVRLIVDFDEKGSPTASIIWKSVKGVIIAPAQTI
jgi:hypothetical protein